MPTSAKGRRPTHRGLKVALKGDLAAWARRRSKRVRKPVAAVINDVLREEMRKDEAYEAAMKTALEMVKPVMFEKPGGRFPTRDEIYDRPKRWS